MHKIFENSFKFFKVLKALAPHRLSESFRFFEIFKYVIDFRKNVDLEALRI